MKIGIDIRVLTDKYYSGIPYFTLEFLENLLKIDQKNEYKLFYNSLKGMKKDFDFFDYPHVEVIKTNYPNKLFNYFFQKGLHYPKIDKRLGNVDVFYAPHFNFFSLSNKCKKIITVHDLSFLYYKNFFSQRKNFWHKMLNVSKILKNFDIIIAVSNNTKNDIIEFFDIPEEKVKVVYPGINEKYQKLNQNLEKFLKVKDKYNLPNKFVLCLGNIEPRKNIESVILGFDDFCNENINNDLELLIVGGNGWKNKKIFNILNKIKNSDKIKFTGYIDEEDKVFIYNLAEIFVYPSFYEGFGFPPLEAMACGVPVIASNNSSLPEVVKNAGIMIDADNIAEIKEAIKLLYEDKQLRELLKIKNVNNIKDYSWKNVAYEYLNLLKLN